MPDPYLTRDAPIVDLVHPPQELVGKARRMELNPAVPNGGRRRLRHPPGTHEPLLGEHRLDDRSRTLGVSDRVLVVFDSLYKVPLFEPADQVRACLEAVLTGERAGVFVERPILVQDVDHFKVLADAHLIVVGIVAGRHLHRARTERRIDGVVGDNRNPTFQRRHLRQFSDQSGIPVVFRMDRYGRVPQNRLGPCGRHHDVPAVRDGIPDVPQLARNSFVQDFEVRDRRAVLRVPVDQIRPFVDQSLLVETNESFVDRPR